jgi:hypothetical protein
LKDLFPKDLKVSPLLRSTSSSSSASESGESTMLSVDAAAAAAAAADDAATAADDDAAALPFLLPLVLFLFKPMLFVILKFLPLKRFVLLASKPANTRYVAVRAFFELLTGTNRPI